MDENKDQNNETPDFVERSRGFFKKYCGEDLSGGEWISVEHLLRHWKSLLFILAVLLLYIGNRYNCSKNMQEVRRLQDEIRDLRYESVALSSELTGIGQPSQIEKLLKEKEIEIAPAHTPSYEIVRKDYDR